MENIEDGGNLAQVRQGVLKHLVSFTLSLTILKFIFDKIWNTPMSGVFCFATNTRGGMKTVL